MITINRDTGAVTWDVYTIQPDMTVADFREQIASLTPSGDKAHFDESVPEPPLRGIFGFLKRDAKDHQTMASHCRLPRISLNGILVTGLLLFEDRLLHELIMELELPDQAEGDPFPAYNRFLIDLLGLTSDSLHTSLERPFSYYADWGRARTVRGHEGTHSADIIICEVRYKTPQERAARPPQPAPGESMPDIATLIAAQKAYDQAKAEGVKTEIEAKRLHLLQLVNAATSAPKNNVYNSLGATFPVQQAGAKHFALLARLDHYVQSALLQKKDEEAVAAASVMLLLEPDDPAIYAVRAEAYRTLKHYDEALADFSEAIQKVTQNPVRDMKTGAKIPGLKAEYLWKRGYVYRLQGDYTRAMADYTQSIAEQPDAQAFTLRASAHLHQLHFQAASADFEKALELKPDNPTYQYNRGICRAFLNDLDGALSDIQAANHQVKDNAIIIGSIAWVYRLRQEFPLAVQFAEQAIQLNSDYGPPYYSRGAARAALGDAAGALADFQVALERWEEVRTPLYAPFAKEMDDFIATHRGDEA
jgi:tetratricopeptide (TPR) repeat protein